MPGQDHKLNSADGEIESLQSDQHSNLAAVVHPEHLAATVNIVNCCHLGSSNKYKSEQVSS